MPIYFDVQKVQAIQLNDQIRKAAYSFDIHNNNVRIFPIPNTVVAGYNDKMFFHYILKDERNNPVVDNRNNLITNVSNVPYTNPVYIQINSVGKPTKEFDPEKIGIKVVRTDLLLPDYLYYVFEFLVMNGAFASMSRGTTNLKNISIDDVKNLPVGQRD
jgi:restriction endonuclease S subunit